MLQNNILNSYADRVLEYAGTRYTVGSATARSDTDTAVEMTVYPPDSSPVNLVWRVREKKTGEHKIIDVAVEGVSMSITHRTEFSSLIQRNGGKVEALLNALRNKKIEVMPELDK